MRLSQRDLAIALRARELGALKWARVELKEPFLDTGCEVVKVTQIFTMAAANPNRRDRKYVEFVIAHVEALVAHKTVGVRSGYSPSKSANPGG